MYETIKSLAATSKRTEKEAILKDLSPENAELFKRVAIATYCPFRNYWMTSFDMPEDFHDNITLDTAISQLMQVTSRVVTGHAARKFMTHLAGSLSEENAEVLQLIIGRDLKCGASESTVNKIWPDTIYVHPYERCSSFNAKNLANIRLPAFSQTKEDGLYIDVVIRNKEVSYRSRSGAFKEFNSEVNDPKFRLVDNIVFMGEALVWEEDFSAIMSRKAGNGYLNSDDIDPKRICFVFWDMIPIEDYDKRKCAVAYKIRLMQLKKFIEMADTKNLMLSDTKVVNSVKEIIEHFKEKVLEGLEGTVVKNMDAPWEDGDSKDKVKIKIEFECELKIVGVELGTGKNTGKLGAYQCESADGLVKVSVGGGFSDKQRSNMYEIGSVIGVKSNDLVDDVTNPGVWSLFLPRHTKLRPDKKNADTYNTILEQRDAFIHTLEAISL